MRRVSIHKESWASRVPFRITGRVWNDFPALCCEIAQDGLIGRGEAEGVYYLDETIDSIYEQLESVTGQLAAGTGRDELLQLLPPGGARLAADSALWDLEAKLSKRSAWEFAGVQPRPVETVYTIGIEPEPEDMAAVAAAAQDYMLFKIKLDGDRPVERIEAIRKARGDARIVIDANEGWDFAQLKEVAPELARLGVSMIEQPLPRGEDAELEGYRAPVPLCADESCLHLGELEDALRRYQMINIKLDKTGGLTHGLELAHAARERGLGLMVGCMGGTSRAMAPSHVLAQLCDLVDIDGPLLLKNDRLDCLLYDGGIVSVPRSGGWGR